MEQGQAATAALAAFLAALAALAKALAAKAASQIHVLEHASQVKAAQAALVPRRHWRCGWNQRRWRS